MWFERDINGIKIKLRINNYKYTNKKDWDSEWCQCDFLFYSGSWLNYHKENDEIFLCSEIDYLIMLLTELLNNKIFEPKEFSFIEPDFTFMLHPIENLKDNPKYIYVKPESKFVDIYLDWKIYFWDNGTLTDNHLTLTLDRDEITSLRDYLVSITTR